MLLVLFNLASAAMMSAGPLIAEGSPICAGHHHAGAPDQPQHPTGDCCSGCGLFCGGATIAPCPETAAATMVSAWTAVAFHAAGQASPSASLFTGNSARGPPAFA